MHEGRLLAACLHRNRAASGGRLIPAPRAVYVGRNQQTPELPAPQAGKKRPNSGIILAFSQAKQDEHTTKRPSRDGAARDTRVLSKAERYFNIRARPDYRYIRRHGARVSGILKGRRIGNHLSVAAKLQGQYIQLPTATVGGRRTNDSAGQARRFLKAMRAS